MSSRVKIHDGVIGALLVASTLATVLVDTRAVWLVGLTGAIMVSSAFTGFCPVHFVVRRVMPEPNDR
jgi:hypothetical protein